MYLIVIHVPFQPAGDGTVHISSDWARSLRLLRDSLQARFGPIVVAAPSLPKDYGWPEQREIVMEEQAEHISFVSLCDADLRARRFWRVMPSVYRKCRRLAAGAQVVHAGMSDLYRPISQLGFLAALRSRVPTVFVEDTDIITQLNQLENDRTVWRTRVYCRLYAAVMKWAVRRADLTLLKAGLLLDRFGAYARNARSFHDTSYSRDWVVPLEELEKKLASQSSAAVLRCVSLGRLVERKGVRDNLRVLAALKKLGVAAKLDFIGSGPEREPLGVMAKELGLEQYVRFAESQDYGPELLADLRKYDLLLFTPIAEDTPRSLFDALAAGLPIAGYGIDYVKTLLSESRCGVWSPVHDADGLAARIQALWEDPSRFAAVARSALVAGQRHAAEPWYERRAAWTIDAVRLRLS